MAKGLYTQGVAVLLKAPISLDQLAPLLKGFKVTGRAEAAESWQLSGPSLLLEYSPKLKGCLQIDVVDHPWPDTMGNLNDDPVLLEAWSAGAFGPFCFPGSLERACQQCFPWPEAPKVVPEHKAFLRVRITYSLGADPEEARVPRGVSSSEEIEMVLGVAEALVQHPSALCYFNPNGEVLAPPEMMAKIYDQYHEANILPMSLLANRRIYKFEGSDWMLMDIVGMGQLDQIDLEAGFTDKFDPNEIAVFLMNAAMKIIKQGTPIKNGHTVTGPNGVLFEARSFDEPRLVPPREVLRFRPRDGTISPSELGFGDKPLGKKAWWQFWQL